jgi:hypothetical protein
MSYIGLKDEPPELRAPGTAYASDQQVERLKAVSIARRLLADPSSAAYYYAADEIFILARQLLRALAL